MPAPVLAARLASEFNQTFWAAYLVLPSLFGSIPISVPFGCRVVDRPLSISLRGMHQPNVMMNTQSSSATLKIGQVWKLTDSRIEIGFVGRTLVHYRQLRGPVLRTPTQLASQAALEKELRNGNAVLLDEAASCPPAGLLRIMKPRSKKIANP